MNNIRTTFTLILMMATLLIFGTAGSITAQTADFTLTSASVNDYTNYNTIPADYPNYSMTVLDDEAADGYIFTASHFQGIPYLLILEDNGDPVFFHRFEEGTNLFNFQPHLEFDQLSYFTRRLGEGVRGYLWNNSYQEDGEMGLTTYSQESLDFHDYHVRPNGNRITVAYVETGADMRPYDPNGQEGATLVEFAFEEHDADGNLLFNWDSTDQYDIAQARADLVDLAGERVDYVHGNAVEPDTDGNYLVTVRNYSEITKIDGQTGDVMWRMGGKSNQFTFINDDAPNNLSSQHDTRRLENGNLLVFDNRYNADDPDYSRVVEYELDEVNKIATNVWEYRHPNNIYTRFAGNAQRLPNGNTLIGWGSSVVAPSPAQTAQATMTEVTPDGKIVFEMVLDEQIIYRAYRFPWVGNPVEPPILVGSATKETVMLSYSWNGATEVASYNIYADDALIGSQTKSQFEEATEITPAESGAYRFRVVPVDQNGIEMMSSNTIELTMVPSAVQLSHTSSQQTVTTNNLLLIFTLILMMATQTTPHPNTLKQRICSSPKKMR